MRRGHRERRVGKVNTALPISITEAFRGILEKLFNVAIGSFSVESELRLDADDEFLAVSLTAPLGAR